MLKRTMYGRASFALLRRRVLLATWSTQSAGEPRGRGRISETIAQAPARFHPIRADERARTSSPRW